MDRRRARRTAAFDAVFDEFDRLDALMSVWKEGSDIEQLNRAAGDKAVPVERRRPRGPQHGAAGQRVDGREVRRHLRRALGTLEVRSRSRRKHSGTR